MKATFAMALALFALGCLIGHGTGCSPTPKQVAQSVENAAAVAQYEALLAPCRERGKAARDYAVYEACADEVDSHLCEQHGVMCQDGGR